MLPLSLQTAIAARLAAKSGLHAGVKALTDIYRIGGASSKNMDFDSYLAARLPATFAATKVCLEDLSEIVPDFAPRSILDVGSGPGTASWAAAEVWCEIAEYAMLDNNQNFLNLAKELVTASENESLRATKFITGDARKLPIELKADLVVAAYTFAELADQHVQAATQNLWNAATQILIIVEPGSKHGFTRIAEARKTLIAQGADIIGPCGHKAGCPMAQSDWCHFSVRLNRTRAHLHAKLAHVPFEDEPYSYVIASRTAHATNGHRILSRPIETKPARAFKLCTPEGIVIKTIATRDKAAYKSTRKLEWGDRFHEP